ncbi:hypothetical protein JXB41_08460 [Candidatus Woesearchaeota archaeon]|nr:hypothetical protein [Candidatus Woesearchaeota archaeon]
MKNKKTRFRFKKRYILYILLGLLTLPLLILYYYQIKAAIFVTAFIVGNVLLSAYKKNFQLPIEIEILSLGIVLCTFLYGIKAGMVIAVFGTILSSAFYGYYSPFLIPMVIGNIIVCIATPFFPVSSLFVSGTILTLIKNTFVFLFYHFVFNYDIGKNLSFGVTNVLLNIILFMNIGPFLFTIMR